MPPAAAPPSPRGEPGHRSAGSRRTTDQPPRRRCRRTGPAPAARGSRATGDLRRTPRTPAPRTAPRPGPRASDLTRIVPRALPRDSRIASSSSGFRPSTCAAECSQSEIWVAIRRPSLRRQAPASRPADRSAGAPHGLFEQQKTAAPMAGPCTGAECLVQCQCCGVTATSRGRRWGRSSASAALAVFVLLWGAMVGCSGRSGSAPSASTRSPSASSAFPERVRPRHGRPIGAVGRRGRAGAVSGVSIGCRTGANDPTLGQ